MARTWTLQATLTGAVGDSITGYACSDSSTLYFARAESTGWKVYQWGPVGGFIDISGSTFNSLNVAALAIFNNSLYARVFSGGYPSYIPYIYKYSGSGTSWTQVWAGSSLSTTSSSAAGDLEVDDDRIVLFNRHNGGVDVLASTDGSTWNAQTAAGGSFSDTTNILLGKSRLTAGAFGQVVIFDGDCWQYSSGNDWQKLNASAVSANVNSLCGYVDGKSWFINAADNALYYSTDWGVTVSTSTGSLFSSIKVWVMDIATDAIEAMDDQTDERIFTYTPATTTWADDGTPVVGGAVYHVFRIGSTIYALVQNGNDAQVYSGGSITLPTAKFYQGVNTLTYRSDLPAGMTDVTRGGMLVRASGQVIVASRVPNSIMVAQAGPGDNFASWTDITGTLSANRITTIQEI